jgi:hypothetical protein
MNKMDITNTLAIIAIVVGVVGIFVAVIIGAWQIHLAKKQQQAPTTIVMNTPGTKLDNTQDTQYKERPLPSEVIDQINNLPVLQQTSASSSYIGIKVIWQTTLCTIDIRKVEKKDIAHLMMRDRGTYPWIYCDVELSNYPELKIMKEGHEIWVRGEIKEVDGNVIYLDHSDLKFE